MDVCAQSLQSHPILCDPIDCSPWGSSVHGISQARILEGIALPSSLGYFPDPEIEPASLASLLHRRRILYHWATREALRANQRLKKLTAEYWMWAQLMNVVELRPPSGGGQWYTLARRRASSSTSPYPLQQSKLGLSKYPGTLPPSTPLQSGGQWGPQREHWEGGVGCRGVTNGKGSESGLANSAVQGQPT